MNDYCNGIAYATGYFLKTNGSQYLIARNLDDWYVKMIASQSKYKAYMSKHNIVRDGRAQWTIKAKDIQSIPALCKIQKVNDFCRAYIEIHGVLDLATAKNRRGNYFKKPRLRIYGKEEIMLFLNDNLPAQKKKIQYISNSVSDLYIGQTWALYYQSQKEIMDILNWIDGKPRNDRIWNKWKEVMDCNR